MNMRDLEVLANRPAACISDAEVAEAIAAILADVRVTKAVHVGRDSDDVNGRQMIDFAMPGFSGIHTLGRVISALGEEARVNAAAAAKQAADQAKIAKKNAADRVELLKNVPAAGRNAGFDRYLASKGADEIGQDDRAEAHVEYMVAHMDGLTGSIKQRMWAADIRYSKTSSPRFDAKRAATFKKFKSAKVWIDGDRDHSFYKVLEAVK